MLEGKGEHRHDRRGRGRGRPAADGRRRSGDALDDNGVHLFDQRCRSSSSTAGSCCSGRPTSPARRTRRGSSTRSGRGCRSRRWPRSRRDRAAPAPAARDRAPARWRSPARWSSLTIAIGGRARVLPRSRRAAGSRVLRPRCRSTDWCVACAGGCASCSSLVDRAVVRDLVRGISRGDRPRARSARRARRCRRVDHGRVLAGAGVIVAALAVGRVGPAQPAHGAVGVARAARRVGGRAARAGSRAAGRRASAQPA